MWTKFLKDNTTMSYWFKEVLVLKRLEKVDNIVQIIGVPTYESAKFLMTRKRDGVDWVYII